MMELRDIYLKMTRNGPDRWGSVLLFAGLYPFSLIFALIVKIRTFFYRCGFLPTFQANVPVVSVGNLTTGGTGKTPVVDYLVKWFIAKGVKTAVVSRGYGGTYTEKYLPVEPDNGQEGLAGKVGDEPYLLATRNPEAMVYVARERWRGVEAAERAGAECILLDDAFQHHGVARDCNIVLLDATRPFGNGVVLPAGPLREGKAALERADLLIMTRSLLDQSESALSDKPVCHCLYRLKDEVTSLHGESVPIEKLQGLSGLAFAGVASPDSFFDLLKDNGLNLIRTLPLADHCAYDKEQTSFIKQAAEDVDYLVTTEKDAVKLSGLNLGKTCYVASLELAFQKDEILDDHLHAILHKIESQRDRVVDKVD